jgi:hypothetical protein
MTVNTDQRETDMGDHRFAALPPVGAWHLSGAYEGFEVVRFTPVVAGTVLDGTTVGVEDGVAWRIHYRIEVDAGWHVRHATVSDGASTRLEIQADGAGSWLVNGESHPELAGCLDLDFEASAVTNTLPVHRLGLSAGERGESAAVYIRSVGLAVERLDQTYRRLPDADGRIAFDYDSPRFGYHDTLHFAADGLILDYPGIAARVPVKD